MARIVALVYDWWSIFTRMGTGARYGEALTTKPLFQQAVMRRTRHANQTKLSILSIPAKARQAAHLLDRIGEWLSQCVQSAEQLAQRLRWGEMLVRIFAEFGQFPLNEKSENTVLVPGDWADFGSLFLGLCAQLKVEALASI